MKARWCWAVTAALLTGGFAPRISAQSVPVQWQQEADLYRQAADLYGKAMYSRARELYSSLAGSDESGQAAGMALLCEERMNADGYPARLERYVAEYPYSGLVPQLYFRHGLNLFEADDYAGALRQFNQFPEDRIEEADKAEFLFKKAYCAFETGNEARALSGFAKVASLPLNDYTAPARYAAGYIHYEQRDFAQALKEFEESAKDPRFAQMSAYYILESRFMMKDYDYVTRHGADIYEQVPPERRPHLARLISEAYLVKGDPDSAKRYYDAVASAPDKGRGDWFYAGSLLYALSDYPGAIENYTQMPDRTDSLGQVANYHLGFSYIQTKNKVAALDAFKEASAVGFDPQTQEDAFFNYAKLAFDLNNDGSVFEDYLARYSDRAKGDRIYSYMALSALYNHDYAGAVAAYDNIDVLDPDMRTNYMKANYLRANQLIGNGAWRAAVPCLKAAAYYSDKLSPFNQLSRYWLAESYYRDDQFAQARAVFNDLYNLSALDRTEEGDRIPYNIAYCYFKEGNNEQAVKWFDTYLETGDASVRKDAMVRKGDCAFVRRDYKTALSAYTAALRLDPDPDDVYPYYQAGLACGLSDDPAKKIEMLSNVRQASPDAAFYPDALYELAHTYALQREDGKALDCFSKLVKTARDSTFIARGLLGMGLVSRNMSQYDDALRYYKQVVAQMPSTPYSQDALVAIESIYQTKEEPEQYLAYIESLDGTPSRKEGDRATMLFNAAEQIFLAGNYQKALVSLQNYESRYPAGKDIAQADFYMAECLKNLGRKEQACDYYKKVSERGEGSFVELSTLNYAQLCYSLERYDQAYEGYKSLGAVARIDNNKFTSLVGMMRSAYKGRNYPAAVTAARTVRADSRSDADTAREADYIQAKSLLATSDRAGAFTILRRLASQTATPEGAEAAYLLIQDSYDQGLFADVEKRVYSLTESGTGQTYWLAKSLILLGDSYVEQEEYRQARATFESIRDGYTGTDDILDNVRLRLDKLARMGH